MNTYQIISVVFNILFLIVAYFAKDILSTIKSDIKELKDFVSKINISLTKNEKDIIFATERISKLEEIVSKMNEKQLKCGNCK